MKSLHKLFLTFGFILTLFLALFSLQKSSPVYSNELKTNNTTPILDGWYISARLSDKVGELAKEGYNFLVLYTDNNPDAALDKLLNEANKYGVKVVPGFAAKVHKERDYALVERVVEAVQKEAKACLCPTVRVGCGATSQTVYSSSSISHVHPLQPTEPTISL